MDSIVPAELLKLKALLEAWRATRKYARQPIPEDALRHVCDRDALRLVLLGQISATEPVAAESLKDLFPARSRWPFRAAQFAFQQPPVIASHAARFGFSFRQTGGERVFAGGFHVERELFNDFDLAFGRQSQRGEMFAHDVVPVRHSSVVAQGF